jgi:site-specific DNA-methyltransferase (adenine-specific)
MSIAKTLLDIFKSTNFKLTDAYQACPNTPHPSVRARIYENLNVLFERIDKGVYKTITNNQEAILIEGDGRDISFIKDQSVDCIMTDHPWDDKKSNRGGSRNFTTYKTFKYNQHDFDEKARVLKPGHFLIEFIPNENANNYEYLHEIKSMAKNSGFKYYAKIPWKKGTFVANTGRTAKNTEDVMIFTKGKAMALRPNAKKNKQTGTTDNFMSGAKAMMPTCFDYQPPRKKDRLHPSEKPVDLLQAILSYVTNNYDIVLDQFTGSGSSMIAAIKNHCKVIGIELSHTYCEKIKNRFKENNLPLIALTSKETSEI